jgi:hypothetical protein
VAMLRYPVSPPLPERRCAIRTNGGAGTPGPVLDAFWPDIWRHLRLDVPGDEVRHEVDAGLDRLATEIEADRQGLTPETASTALAERIAAFLKLPEMEPHEYG